MSHENVASYGSVFDIPCPQGMLDHIYALDIFLCSRAELLFAIGAIAEIVAFVRVDVAGKHEIFSISIRYTYIHRICAFAGAPVAA